jgi:hypothetical protein
MILLVSPLMIRIGFETLTEIVGYHASLLVCKIMQESSYQHPASEAKIRAKYSFE